jgi:hypothetical protein
LKHWFGSAGLRPPTVSNAAVGPEVPTVFDEITRGVGAKVLLVPPTAAMKVWPTLVVVTEQDVPMVQDPALGLPVCD